MGKHKNIQKDGKLLVGPTDINGRAGIAAQQPDGSPIRLGGGEIIINEKSSTKHCKELSDINVEGGGVPFDCDAQKTANTDRAAGRMPKDEYHKEHAASGINIHKNPTKNEINDIISGTREVKFGQSIQSAIRLLRKNEATSGVVKRTKREEQEKFNRHKKIISIPDYPKIGDGGIEHLVYRLDGKFLIKTNNGIFYKLWEDYLINLLIHNYLFPATAYELIGFTEEKGEFKSVVKQRFVEATEPNDMNFVREWFTNNGFMATREGDYFNPELGITIEDIHDQNVITENGIVYLIDTVMFIGEHSAAGGALVSLPPTIGKVYLVPTKKAIEKFFATGTADVIVGEKFGMSVKDEGEYTAVIFGPNELTNTEEIIQGQRTFPTPKEAFLFVAQLQDKIAIGNQLKRLPEDYRSYAAGGHIERRIRELEGINSSIMRSERNGNNVTRANTKEIIELKKQLNNMGNDIIYFSIDDEKLDQLLHENFKSALDYHDIGPDVFYKLKRKAYDRFLDKAISAGFDVDNVVQVVDENGKSYEDETYAAKGTRIYDPRDVYSSIGQWKEVLQLQYGDVVGYEGDSPKFKDAKIDYQQGKQFITARYLGEIVGKWDMGLQEGYVYEEPIAVAGGIHTESATGGKKISLSKTAKDLTDSEINEELAHYKTSGTNHKRISFDRAEQILKQNKDYSYGADRHPLGQHRDKKLQEESYFATISDIPENHTTSRAVGRTKYLNIFHFFNANTAQGNEEQNKRLHGHLRLIAIYPLKETDIELKKQLQKMETKPTAKLITEEYSWGTLRKVEFGEGGRYGYAIIHPEQWHGIAELEIGEEIDFTDEQNIHWTVKKIEGNKLFFESKNNSAIVDITDTAASGTQTQNLMKNMYYLTIGNVIKEASSGKHIQIVGFDKNGLKVVDHSIILKDQKPTGIDFPTFARYMDEKAITIEDRPYENDRDKALLANEIAGIIADEVERELAAQVAEASTTAASLAEANSTLSEQVGNVKKAADDTIAGMEAMAGGAKISKMGMQLILEETQNAYSRERYGEAAWKKSIENLHSIGYTEEEIAWILNSKYMRWAMDHAYTGNNYKPTGNEIINYRESYGIDLTELHGEAPKKKLSANNSYAGKDQGKVWNDWNPKQRMHFLEDHVTGKVKHKPSFWEGVSNMEWKEIFPGDKEVEDLDKWKQEVIVELDTHIRMGAYAKGASITNEDLIRKEPIEEKYRIIRRWSDDMIDNQDIEDILSALIKSEVSDSSLHTKPTKTGTQYTNALDKKTEEITKKMLKHYSGRLKGNQPYGVIHTLVDRASRFNDNIIEQFKNNKKQSTTSASGTRIKKLTKKKNFWHARIHSPKGAVTCAVPEWSRTIADNVHPGAKVTTCKFGKDWHVQKIMVPAKGTSKAQAEAIATKIASKINKK